MTKPTAPQFKRILLASILVVSALILWELYRNRQKSERLLFSTNLSILPHGKGGEVTARFGQYRWGYVMGCSPFTIPIENSQMILFVVAHFENRNVRCSFVCIDTNAGQVVESEFLDKLVSGPCSNFVDAKASFDACGLRYVEYDGKERIEYCAKLLRTNYLRKNVRNDLNHLPPMNPRE